jgi:hypothetical protein
MIKKKIHAIADANPSRLLANAFSLIYSRTLYLGFVKQSMIVYTVLTRIIGVRIGNVIFQNSSHFVAPSTFADSNIDGEMDWSADRNIKI